MQESVNRIQQVLIPGVEQEGIACFPFRTLDQSLLGLLEIEMVIPEGSKFLLDFHSLFWVSPLLGPLICSRSALSQDVLIQL